MALRRLPPIFRPNGPGPPNSSPVRARVPAVASPFQLRSFSTRESLSGARIFVSRVRDPYLNLSLEHFLLQASPPSSTILLLYTNRPCIVFGRNQNPWLEINLPLVLGNRTSNPQQVSEDGVSQQIQLVRRRSGGGTVFHDAGNVNWSVICPPDGFDRNTHAEMVVRALRNLGVAGGVRVNCRHDIVMTPPSSSRTPSTAQGGSVEACSSGGKSREGEFKISGSAYKLTRLRSLHHGTCLLSSPNLPQISSFLRSPAAPYLHARGVESVRSPVRNVEVENAAFEDAVVSEFSNMYPEASAEAPVYIEEDDPVWKEEKIRHGVEELRSRAWLFGQTPRFTFSTHPSREDERPRPELPFDFFLHFEAKNGLIQSLNLSSPKYAVDQLQPNALLDESLYDIGNWSDALARVGLQNQDANTVGTWLENVLGDASPR